MEKVPASFSATCSNISSDAFLAQRVSVNMSRKKRLPSSPLKVQLLPILNVMGVTRHFSYEKE